MQRSVSAQRVKQMLERFETQEKLKQEILERERQLKRLESGQENEEVKKSIHKQYLNTKFREQNGHSRWSRENSEEVVERMYNRVYEKQAKIKKNDDLKVHKFEEEIKSYFKPNLVSNINKLHINEERNKKKIVKVQLQRDKSKIKTIAEAEKKFNQENKNTVYERMQKDLELRRVREKKRMQLKKLKDLHYKEYWKLIGDEEYKSDEERQNEKHKVELIPKQRENWLHHYKSRDNILKIPKKNPLTEIPEFSEKNSSYNF